MSFELHPSAEQDLNNAFNFYLMKAGPAVARRFLDEFNRAISFLVSNLGLISRAHLEPQSHSLRIFPYALIYKTVENRIRVLVVRHHRRRPSFGASRS